MGYTHYWSGPQIVNAEFESDVERIIAKAKAQGIKIAGGDGNGKPSIEGGEIVLNGTEHGDEYHETFWLKDGRSEWDFCKTAQKPYDAVVGAILLRQAAINPKFDVSSDGDFGSEDWSGTRKFYYDVFGEHARNFERH